MITKSCLHITVDDTLCGNLLLDLVVDNLRIKLGPYPT